MLTLKDPALFKQACYVDGSWLQKEGDEGIAVDNPATGEIIGHVPNLGTEETRAAVAAAAEALPDWRARTAAERGHLLHRWFELIQQNSEDLAQLMTCEQGKPLSEAAGEIKYAASFVQWYAEEGKRCYGDIIPTHAPDKRILALREPVGVCAAITPWNFPAAMLTRKAAPALAAGCTVVVKPASQTPFSALALAELAERAGIPPGVLNILTGSARDIGGELTRNETVRKLSFTGSTEVGIELMRQSAPTLKKLSLELGGNAPFIVFEDADIDAAVQGAIASKYRNSGQTCVCANRFYVHDSVHDEFVRRFSEAVQALRVGNGLEGSTEQGPLIDDKALSKVESLLKDAREQGAQIAVGGARHELGGRFFQPTVVTEVSHDMALLQEEIFGPVAPIVRFDSEADVVRQANQTRYGLAAYFYGRDMGRIWRVAEALEYGMVGINTGLLSTEVAPFGGVKASGFGREGGYYGIEEYLQVKYLCLGGMDS